MRRVGMMTCLALLVAASTWLFVACGGGGGGGGGTGLEFTGATTQTSITEAGVTNVLGDVEDFLPGCEDVSVGEPAAVAADRVSLFKASSLAIDKVKGGSDASMKVASKQSLLPLLSGFFPPGFDETDVGDCGGTVRARSSHSDGVTTIGFTFNNVCIGVPGVETFTLDGDLTWKEVGTPSDVGPVIDKVTLDSNLLSLTETVNGTSETTEVAFSNIEYIFGTPGVIPGDPTEAAPDLLNVGTLLIKNGDSGAVVKLEDLAASIAGNDLGDTIIEITGGRYFMPTAGYVEIATVEGDPLVINELGALTGGSLVLTGTDGEVTVTPQANGMIDIAVNGNPLGTTVNCAELLGDLGDVELPIE